ncbi:hypothetical protein [Okeania hirsuta]|uniref:hypothetical protein n=1 Tax=Okeania hirsuta TaxID=1458930 RepID=UPI000F531B43|nr:hypothetical protein [Okeania hirsuta]RQH19331.1 hypothetical protein D4Z78_14020 [Okeania hirsuta]
MGFRRFTKADIPQVLLWFDDPAIRLHLDGFEPPQQQFELILHHVNRWAYVWEVAEEIQAFAEVELEEDWANLLIMVNGPKDAPLPSSTRSCALLSCLHCFYEQSIYCMFSAGRFPICRRGRRHGKMGMERIIPENASITDALSGNIFVKIADDL